VRLKLQLFALFLLPAYITLNAQTRVSFSSGDGLSVVADKYFVHDTLPWILMFHQSGSSRGEFREIAPKLIRLGYNALAVDLRHGKEINFVANETTIAAQVKNLPRTMTDARMDMLAAMEWTKVQSDKPFILFGSSYSASLAMILARDNPGTSSVIAFSPGEFFGAPNLVRNAVRNLDVPVFLASTRREYPYITELSSGIGADKKIIFTPSESQGTHGAKALWESEPGNKEYWLSLLMFFNRIQNTGN
jgi:pimeloyl-ACP methyl ester carboxylesterase